jgi:hypothetical protein
MDIKKYDDLRKKINTKDFEGKNKDLDKWLYRFSFFGNVGSIFFAYFLVYPSLLKAITTNLISNSWGSVLAFLFTVVFLVMFEIVKRYLIRNFSHDFVINSNKIKINIFSWFVVSAFVIVLSFYLSIMGSKNLASTSIVKNEVKNIELINKTDNINSKYNKLKEPYYVEINTLREANRQSRNIQNSTSNAWERRENEKIISSNEELIKSYEDKIAKLDIENKIDIQNLQSQFLQVKEENKEDAVKNIFLFVIIVIFNELIIIGGVYFREFFEYNLYLINQQKFEKIYTKRDRYRSLLMFIYGEGKSTIGDKVIPSLELKAIIAEKTNIQNSNKMVDEFLRDMDNLGIFSTTGKRRHIAMTYGDAINLIERYDDAFRILENLR